MSQGNSARIYLREDRSESYCKKIPGVRALLTFLLLLELEVYFKALRVNSVSESSAIQSSPQAE